MIEHWIPDSRAINASAGYGKTEALAVRLLAIFLSDDVSHHVQRGDEEYNDAARNTVALTFARAAAGEIYERMLLLLSRALEDDEELEKLRRKFLDLVYTHAFDGVTREELGELLVRLVREMGKLNIATIDSFFYRLIRAYSIELGLPGTVEMLSDGIDGVLGGELIRKLLTGTGTDDEVLENCRMSWYGDDQKSFFDGCRELMRDTLKFRDRHDRPDFWGGDFRIFAPVDRARRQKAWEICRTHEWGNLTGKNLDRKQVLLALLDDCRRADSWEHRFPLAEQNLLREFLEVKGIFPTKAPTGYKQGWRYTPEVVAAIYDLVENGRRALLAQCARRTQALQSLTEKYLELYRSQVLYRGRLTFADLPMLLEERPADSATQLGFLYEIFYRTNCHFRHFLIDEFQDTSRAQWRVLDSVSASNDEGDHSLFIVGDVKQAIYGWRSGDSKLMGDVVVQRSLPEPTDLACSYRYGTGICEGLNHIFGSGNISGVVERLGHGNWTARIPAKYFRMIGDIWSKAFKPHAADPDKEIPGELSVLALAPDNQVDFAEGAARLIVDRMRELKFFERKLSGGVLVRDKASGILLRDTLLQVDPSLAGAIVWEGDENIIDDPLVASLVAFGIWIQHSADARSGGIVRMNQLMRELVENDFDRMHWATAIAERGIHGFLCEVLTKLSARNISWGNTPGSDWTPINNGDVHTLLALAREFDAGAEPRDFLRFAERAAAAKKKAVAIPGKLRMLTIHHSKGLTFDVVFLPMFKPGKGGNWKHLDTLDMTTGESEKHGEWLLRAPRIEGLVETDIAAALDLMHADDCLEELCVLYVALTRARYGMYVYLPPLTNEKRNAFHRDWAEEDKFSDRRYPESLDTTYYMSDFLFGSCFYIPEAPDAAPEVPNADPLRRKYPLFSEKVELPVRTLPAPPPRHDSPEAAAEAAQKKVRYIQRLFGEKWDGEREKKKQAKTGKVRQPAGPLAVEFVSGELRPRRSTPSKLGEERKLYFTLPHAGGGAMLGTRVHKFFESIERLDDRFVPPPGTDPEILHHYNACKDRKELAKLLNDGNYELWRERPFDVMVTDGDGGARLISGCFDRVQIYRDGDGAITRACIIDYKSNRIEDAEDAAEAEAEHYREQLESYRQALAKLLGLTPNIIDCRLVFTFIGAVVEVK